MPRSTSNWVRHARSSSRTNKEYYNREYDGRSQRSSYEKHRDISRSPSRKYRRYENSRSRSGSIFRSRHSRRERSRSHSSSRHRRYSSSRSRSRSMSRYKKHKKSKREYTPKYSRHRKESQTVKDKEMNENYSKESVTNSNFTPYMNYTEEKEEQFVKINTENNYSHNEDLKTDQSCSNYLDDDFVDPIDKERIHKQIEEKLREALAKEGKVYPPPKTEASHPVFANDGSFLEVFKKMQEQANQKQQIDNANPISKPLCKRRGGKILKTGIVTKPKADTVNAEADPKDFWSIYLQEVKKYKNASCDIESKTRPLVK